MITATSTRGQTGEAARQSRRQDILEAAERCFAAEGFHGASMQTICAEAGMSPGVLYRHFASKDDIIAAIAEDERARAHRILNPLSGPGDFTEKIVACALDYCREMARPGAVPLMLEVMAEGLRNTNVGVHFMCNEALVREAFTKLVAEAAAAGEIDANVDHEAAIGFLLAVGEGVVLRRRFDESLSLERLRPLLAATAEGLFRPDRHRVTDTAEG